MNLNYKIFNYFKRESPVRKNWTAKQTVSPYKCLKNSQRTRTGYEPTDRSSMILMSFVVFSLKLATLSPASLPTAYTDPKELRSMC